MATVPLMVALPLVTCRAPADDTPVPETVRFSASVTPLPTARVAPLATVVLPAVVPSALAWPATSVPALMVVAPV
ncbi:MULTISPECIES: hypothetical protein [unclassified Azospirillum]|uniref:hypothetical protein n=1 Tax=unclassified Azospirillum TaxID=2630922 RepID=UPI001FFEE19A|nr:MULTISPECIES: hypothetical protein [unclassified Azospirillum]